MKANITYVPMQSIKELAAQMGATVEEQAGFYKITGPLPGKALYPTRRKSVSRIDVSGFGETILEGCIKHPKPPTKRVTMLVKQEGVSVEQIIATITALVNLMVSAKVEPVEGKQEPKTEPLPVPAAITEPAVEQKQPLSEEEELAALLAEEEAALKQAAAQ